MDPAARAAYLVERRRAGTLPDALLELAAFAGDLDAFTVLQAKWKVRCSRCGTGRWHMSRRVAATCSSCDPQKFMVSLCAPRFRSTLGKIPLAVAALACAQTVMRQLDVVGQIDRTDHVTCNGWHHGIVLSNGVSTGRLSCVPALEAVKASEDWIACPCEEHKKELNKTGNVVLRREGVVTADAAWGAATGAIYRIAHRYPEYTGMGERQQLKLAVYLARAYVGNKAVRKSIGEALTTWALEGQHGRYE